MESQPQNPEFRNNPENSFFCLSGTTCMPPNIQIPYDAYASHAVSDYFYA